MEQNNIKKRVIGVDISTVFTTYAIVDVRGNIIAHDHFPTRDYPGIAGFIEKLAESIVEISEANGGYETIRSVGISAPSGCYVSGCIENSGKLPWKGVIPLAVMLRERLGIAAALGNNAHNAALAEKTYGLAHGMKNFIVLTIGAGLGSCFYSDGHDHQGASGYAGEFGHTCIEENGRPCACGLNGCLEAYVSSGGLLLTARELMAESDAPSKMRDIEHLDPQIITQLCDEGDELAMEVYRRTGHFLGRGLATYATLINPEAIILTGGVALADHWLIDPAREAFESHVFPSIRGKVPIIHSDLNNEERDVLGASALAWEAPEYSLFK